MIDKELLKTTALQYGVTISDQVAEKFDRYAELLVEWNEKMNLTAITDPTDIVVKHFVDSVTAAKLLPEGPFSLIDVGTGAGFPGVPLALVRPDCKLTLLDSLNKRLVFLETVCRELGVKATLIHSRAEDGGKNPTLRESFDVATARAVGVLPLLCEYCLPFVKQGGRFIALKGPANDEETGKAKKAMAVLGGTQVHLEKCILPPDKNGEQGNRQIVVIEKTAPTPTKYPRPAAKIAKNPW